MSITWAATLTALICFLSSPLHAQVGMGGGPPGGHDFAAPSRASNAVPFDNVRIDQKLDSQVPPDLTFRDEDGRVVRLGEYFGRRPLILSLVYYKCPGLCTVSLNTMEQALKELSTLNVGRDFDVLTVSFDPAEKPELAAAKKREYLRLYNRPGAEAGWHFLTGDPEPIRQLADAVGFRYRWDPEQQQFIHPGTIMILTPQGRVSQYIVGVDYPPMAIRSSLIAATTNKIGEVDPNNRFLYCFLRDPHTGKIVLITARALHVGAVLTLVGIGALLFFMMRHHPPAAPVRCLTEGCGLPLPAGTTFCPRCGREAVVPSSDVPSSDSEAAGGAGPAEDGPGPAENRVLQPVDGPME